MMTKQAMLAMLILGVAGSDALACGYGLFDPDVELACSGDPLQARPAVARLLVRGEQAIPVVLRYQDMAQRQNVNQREYLAQLVAGEHEMAIEDRREAILRARRWIEWNENRLGQLDMLLFLLRGKSFATNVWCWLPAQG